jgi:hypothetical protein
MTRTEHLLTIAAEECAEIAQRCSKALRFGLNQIQQDADDKPEENPQRLNNISRIRMEFADLLGVLNMLNIVGLRENDTVVVCAAEEKQRKVELYLVRSRREGTLSD